MAKKSPPSLAPSKPADPSDPSPRTSFAPPPPYGAGTAPGADTPRLRATPPAPRRPVFGGEVAKVKETPAGSSWPFWTGVAITLAWFGSIAAVAFDPAGTVFGLPVTQVALGMAGAVAPPALLWMIMAYLQRATDIRAITDPLRRQLQMVLGTGAAAENRVRRFNDALERQLDLLKQAGEGSFDVLQESIQVLHEEEQAIHILAERSSKEVSRVAGVVRDNTEVLEVILGDNRERFTDLSAQVANQVATLDERAGAAADRLEGMVERLHGLIGEFLQTADKKLSSFGSLSGQISAQEQESAEAARRMTEMLASARSGAGELNQILVKNQELLEDASVRLLARIQEISGQTAALTAASETQEMKFAEKSERLSQTLAREIAALDTLTGRLESQIAATSDGIGTRARDLEEKHNRLTDQATQLLQGLDVTVQNMENSAANAYGKFATTAETVQIQTMRAAQQFQTSSEQYDTVAAKLEDISHKVVERLATIEQSLTSQSGSIVENSEKAARAAEAANAGVSGTLEKLEFMIARIFDAEERTKSSVGEVTKAYGVSLDALQGKLDHFGKEASGHLNELNLMQDQFDEAGSRLATRARETEATWQSLVSAAERQQELLQAQLRSKMEEATALLNEQAVAIEAARDSMHINIEAAFVRAEAIKEELQKMGAAVEKPFEEAVARVQTAVQQGQYQITQFIESLGRNARQLGDLNVQLAEQEEKAGHKAAETLAGLDAVAARIEAIQAENMQATQNVLLRLSSLAQQLQARMGELSSTAEGEQRKLAEVSRQLSLEINGLIHDSQTADQRVRMAAALLSEQAGEVRLQLEGQADVIGERLAELKVRFADVAEQMQEISRINDTGLEGKVEHLSQVVREASARLENLGSHINERASQLVSMQGQLGESGRALDDTTQAALDRLSVFTHALVSAQGTSQDAAQQVFGRLNDMQEQFQRQIAAVSEGSQTITQSMREAVSGLVEQSVALAAASEAAETRIGSLSGVTDTLHTRAESTRSAIEAQVNEMANRFGTLLAHIESTTVGLERNATIAFDRSEGMAKRFENLSDTAFITLGNAADQVARIADAANAKVEDVSRALTDQAEKVTFAGVHLAEVEAEVRQSAERHVEILNHLAGEAGSKAVFAADQLRQQIEALKGEAEGMLARFSLTGEGFSSQAETISSAAAALEGSLVRMQDTCNTLGEAGHATAGKIAGQTTHFRQEVEEALQNMSASGDALEKRSDFAISMLHQMAGRFAEATQNLGGQFESGAKHLEDVSNTAQARLEDFGARLTSHTDRLDSMAGVLSGSGQQIGEALEKANFLLRNLTTQTDRVKAGVQEIGSAMLQRLSEMLCTFEDELNGLTSGANTGLDALERRTGDLEVQLRERSRVIAEALGQDMDQALIVTTGQLAEMQKNFRTVLGSAAEVLVSHLKQVQESSTGVMEVVRQGAVTGTEQALQLFTGLHGKAEQEVQAMSTSISQSLSQMDNFAGRIREMLINNSAGADQAASKVFMHFREAAERELQGLVARAASNLNDLRRSCEGFTQDLRQALSEVEGAGTNFTRAAQQMRAAGAEAAAGATEASQSFTSAQSILGVFNENLVQQAENLQVFQNNLSQATQVAEATDARITALRGSFEKVLSDLISRLNDGMVSLGKQVLAVRSEADQAIESVGEGAEGIGAKNQAMAQTAGTLARALSQLEAVSRTLSQSLIENTGEVESRTRTLEDQAARIRQVGDTASLAIDALGTRLQSQISRMEMVPDTIRAASMAPIVPPSPRPPAPPMPSRPMPSGPIPTPTPPTPHRVPPMSPPPDSAVRETMQRLKEASENRYAAQAQQQAAPAAPVSTPPAPPPAPPRADDALVASLTQIIRQLEEQAAPKPEDAAQRKINK